MASGREAKARPGRKIRRRAKKPVVFFCCLLML